ncbi:MAG: hypothetical protein HY881_13675 [Deltaproteobacteria bacterium]|nr:hypothetical protein [Deltaproteobacteria bacterium]
MEQKTVLIVENDGILVIHLRNMLIGPFESFRPASRLFWQAAMTRLM